MPVLIPSADLPAFIAYKHKEFSQLNGGSEVNVGLLQPTFQSFVAYFPKALDMAFFQPHFYEIKNLSYLPAVVEIILLFLLLIVALVFYRRFQLSPGALFFIFFGISLMIIAGYTITLSGAIVRYRSFALPFLVIPLLHNRFLKFRL